MHSGGQADHYLIRSPRVRGGFGGVHVCEHGEAGDRPPGALVLKHDLQCFLENWSFKVLDLSHGC